MPKDLSKFHAKQAAHAVADEAKFQAKSKADEAFTSAYERIHKMPPTFPPVPQPRPLSEATASKLSDLIAKAQAKKGKQAVAAKTAAVQKKK